MPLLTKNNPKYMTQCYIEGTQRKGAENKNSAPVGYCLCY